MSSAESLVERGASGPISPPIPASVSADYATEAAVLWITGFSGAGKTSVGRKESEPIVILNAELRPEPPMRDESSSP